MLREKFEELINKLTEEAKKYYGERLVAIVLFGSVARKTQRNDSDIDILLVVKDLPKGRLRRTEEFMKIEEKLEEDLKRLRKEGIYTLISPIIKTPEEVKKGGLFFLDFVFDAVILFDKENFFERFLTNFKEKLKHLGAERYTFGNAWYWVIKPELKSGEDIEL